VLVNRAKLDRVVEWLEEIGLPRLSKEEYDVLRVESGCPGPSGELTAEYTPLEVGLTHLISDEKGCYTGQEVIARQITYDKVTRQLVGITLAEFLSAGATVSIGERNVGQLTSAALSPHFGPIALATIKRPHNEAGTLVRVSDGDRETDGVVCALPFKSP
jgi:folate-binding protein YgfZ